MRLPDTPLNFVGVLAETTATQITLQWTQGAESGGVPIIGYRLLYDRGLGTGIFVELQALITTTKYTVFGITEGTWYVFKL